MERRKKHGGRRNKKTKSIQNDPNSTLLQVEVEDNLTDLNQNTLNPNSNNDLNTECETFSDSESIPGVEMIPEIGSNFSDSSGSKVSSRRRLKQEAWEFIRGECFLRDGIRPETVAVWLRTLLDQNSRLVETLNRTRREQEKPKYIRPDPGSIEHMGRNEDLEKDEFTEKTEHNSKLLDTLSIIRSCESSFEVDDGMEKYENETEKYENGTEKYENGTEKYENGTEKTCEERLQGPANLQDIDFHEDQQLWNMEMECRERLERELKEKEEDWMERIRSREKEMREKIEKLEQDNMEIKEYAESLEEQARYLGDYNENLKNDVTCLLKISDKARDTGTVKANN